ncbi:MAG: phosphoribosylaminoimidazolesuccinocarboxamide synthase [Sphingobacteriales bacterium]|nr:MAG: phosphoribosylaminoimidazolesuccinocarboxamide synthase [Sphingobacteriales bacterium]
MSITQTHFTLPKQTHYYKGKVRDVYTISPDILVMIVTDRISAFDVVLPKPIPYKGQILNEIANYHLEKTKDILPNWVMATPHPNVTIGKMCEPFKIEMVVRGYLAGSAWRAYKAGVRTICGVTLEDGLKENQKLSQAIITPTTKASIGHDEEISKEEIIAQNIVSKEDYEQLEKYTHAIFERGTELAMERNLILVDTKYEFGKIGNQIYLMDEIHTPDSSRYFYADGYEERLQNNEPQKQLSKEFVRTWLIENDFMGKEGQIVPKMTDEVVQLISDRYIELYENILGKKFIPKSDEVDMEKSIIDFLGHAS